MNESDTLQFLSDRLNKIEKQNHRMRLLCTFLLLTPILAIVACQSRILSTLAVQKVIIRDKNGKTRIEIGVSYDSDSKGYPVINLFDEKGKELTNIGAGVLNVSGKGASSTLLDNRLQFDSDPIGREAFLDASQTGPRIMLVGNGGEVILDSSNPSIAVTQEDRFQAVLGSTRLDTPETGKTETTSAASLVLSAKNGKILWRTPQ